MALIPARCTQCGANIEVDDKREAGICKYCGTAFITTKAITYYNNTSEVNIQNAKFYIHDNKVKESIDKAEAFIKLNETVRAMRVYEQLTNEFPQESRGWWGLLCTANSGEFFSEEPKAANFDWGKKYYENAKLFANADELVEYETKYNQYIERLNNKLRKQEGERIQREKKQNEFWNNRYSVVCFGKSC